MWQSKLWILPVVPGCWVLIFTCPKSVNLTNSRKCALFSAFLKSKYYLLSFTVFVSQRPFWIQTVFQRLEWNKSYGGNLSFKIGGKKGLPIFKRNLTRLMGSCCYIKMVSLNGNIISFVDSVNITHSGNFKLSIKIWNLKQMNG